MYYYFLDNRFLEKTEMAVDTAIFPQYVEMTKEQSDFWLEHPNASFWEVKETRIIEPYVTPLNELKAVELENISKKSLETSNTIIPSYKIQNALLSLTNNVDNGIYTVQQAEEIVHQYNTVGKQCRDMFYNCKLRIEEAQTAEEVYTIVTEANVYYDDLLIEVN